MIICIQNFSQLTIEMEMLKFVIENKESMVLPSEDWSKIFERFNATILVMKVVLFNEFDNDESQNLLNILTRILLDNMAMVGELHKTEKLDITQITDFQAQIFQKHKIFLQYITNDVKEESRFNHEDFYIMDAVAEKYNGLYGDFNFFKLVGDMNSESGQISNRIMKIPDVKSAESLIQEEEQVIETPQEFQSGTSPEEIPAKENEIFNDPFQVNFKSA